MKKNAIIDIIISDLREMIDLVATFKEADHIEPDFLELLKRKHTGIYNEIELLNHWTAQQTSSEPKVEASTNKIVENEKVESAKSLVAEPEPVKEIAPKPVKKVEEPKPQPVAAPKPVEEIAPKPAPQPKPQPAAKTVNPNDLVNYGTPVDNVAKAFSLSDKFQYQKELFAGSAADFNAAIDLINAASSFDAAHSALIAQYHWDDEDSTVAAFFRAVHRRFL